MGRENAVPIPATTRLYGGQQIPDALLMCRKAEES